MDGRTFRRSIAPTTYERRLFAVVQYYARSVGFTSKAGQHRIGGSVCTQLCGEDEVDETHRHEA